MAIKELTQSSINMMTRCGIQFENRYIKGIIIPPGVAARRGSSLHTGTEHDYRHIIEKGEPAPLFEVMDITREKYRDLVMNEGVWFADEDLKDKKQILSDMLDDTLDSAQFYHNTFTVFDKDVAQVEERLYADLGVGIPISGKPDVVTNGKLTDIKTSGKRWPAGREDEEIQPTLYRMLLRENNLGDPPAEFRIIVKMKGAPRGEGLVWDPTLKVCGDVRQAPRTKHHEEALIHRIKSTVKVLKSGDFLPAYPGTWWCDPKWCGYFANCKYVRGRKSFLMPEVKK